MVSLAHLTSNRNLFTAQLNTSKPEILRLGQHQNAFSDLLSTTITYIIWDFVCIGNLATDVGKHSWTKINL